MTLKPIYKKLFDSYNLAIQNKCEQSLGTVKSLLDFEVLISEARRKWENTAYKNKLPSEYFFELTGAEEMKEAFEIASVVCDEFIPDSFIKYILESDQIDFLKEYAFGDAHIDMRISAIRILGISGKELFTEELITLLYSEGEYEELLKETARRAIIDIGMPAVSYLENILNVKNILSDDDFHLVIALIGIDTERKSDSVFRILKESFKKTSDKALAARCLADYGDGRAVSLLRSYLEKNLMKLDENTIFELQGAVLTLGGSIE